MFDEEDASEMEIEEPIPEEPKKRRPMKIIIPRREPSEEIPQPRVLVLTAGTKPEPIKLNQCQVSPLTLYELAAVVVDKLAYPDPFAWNEEQVADWIEEVVGLPQYKECIIDNHINGRRLLRLEDSSALPDINIRDFTHIKKITSEIRKLFMTDYVLFARSVGLPIRKPLTHCIWFKSKTGPSWGIRQNWTRSDILRWLKIIMPEPIYLDHWDLVWYQKPDWPKVLTARISKLIPDVQNIPRYVPPAELFSNEYMAPRRFILQVNIPKDAQVIWMEHLPGSPSRIEPESKEAKKAKKVRKVREITSSLFPKKVVLTGLVGKDLILARRRMDKPKFLP